MKHINYKPIAIVILSILSIQISTAQQFKDILEQIEHNSPVLAALKKQSDAEIMRNKTGIAPQNPEIEVNHLWGNSSEGNRLDLNVTQSFDFPTVYYFKQKMANSRKKQAQLQYDIGRKLLLFEARNICINLVFINAKQKELEHILSHAQQMHNAYQAKMELGQAGILEINKIKLNLLNTQKELTSNEIEKQTLLSELALMNGGKPILFDIAEYDPYILPPSFEQWYNKAQTNNPQLQFFANEHNIDNQQTKLNKSQWLPKFSLGYRSERGEGMPMHGVGGSISIPLWENINTVKAAKLQAEVSRSALETAKLQFYNSMKIQFNKVSKLQKLLLDYNSNFAEANNKELLQTALENGQISLIEYIIEMSIFFDSTVANLETKRDLQLEINKLTVWE